MRRPISWIPAATTWTSLLLLAAACDQSPGPPPAPAPAPRAGINLAAPADWNTELPLVDVFRFSRAWISQREGAAWAKGPPLRLDEHGWVTSLEPGCFAETPVCTIEDGHYPSGRYTVLYEGQGQIEAFGAGRVVEREPGRIIIDADASRGAIWIRLAETNPADYVRNIRVIMPGFEDSWQDEPWHPDFLSRWRGFAAMRFMDFMKTNHSEIVSWDDRPQLADATWADDGVPVEMLCDLANRVQVDPWFCMPHQADDEFVRAFAEHVRDQLEPDRRVYVEYSNEVWNSIFSQHDWAAQVGRGLGLADAEREAAWKYGVLRSKQVFAIWEEVFADSERIVRVLATQAANPYMTRQLVGYDEAWRHADALAIAPYVSMNVPAEDADAVAALGVDGILDRVERDALPKAINAMQANWEIADTYGLQLIAYEAGQHLVGVRGGQDHIELTGLFHEVNRHPRMGEIYTCYYNAWADCGGDLLCVFSSVGRWTKWGSWGLLEHADDELTSSPKLMATLRWARECGQPVAVPSEEEQ